MKRKALNISYALSATILVACIVLSIYNRDLTSFIAWICALTWCLASYTNARDAQMAEFWKGCSEELASIFINKILKEKGVEVDEDTEVKVDINVTDKEPADEPEKPAEETAE